jgi:hypothetical protein
MRAMRKIELRHDSATGEPTAADGLQGEWTRERLIRMDEKFRERLARALRHGEETPEGAVGIASGR